MKLILLGSSVLILAVLFLRLLFRRTIPRRVQYALWLPVLLRLLIPFSLGSSAWSVASAAQEVRQTEAGELASAVSQLHVPRMSYERAYREVREEMETAGRELSYLDGSELDIRTRQRMRSGITVLGALRFVWWGGMAVMALALMLQNLRFARRLRRTRVLLEEGRYPVYLCDDIPSPCLFGLLRPAVYVTSAAAKDGQKLRYVILHEETHARHLDPLWSLLRCLCLVIWWFDPLVWLAAQVSKLDCELACDEGVLARLGAEDRIPYGETLLALIPQGRGGVSLISATTMTAGKRQMKDRIRRIAEHKRPLVIALAAALVLAAAVCAVTFAGAKGRDKEPAPAPQPTAQPATPGDLAAPTPERSLTDRLYAAADRVFGIYGQASTEYRISVEADGRRDEYTVPAAWHTYRNSVGEQLKTQYRWVSPEEGEIAAAEREAGVLCIWTEQERFEVFAESDLLHWTEENGADHWLRGEPIHTDAAPDYDTPLYTFFLRFAQEAEQDRPFQEIAVPKSVRDYTEVARQVSEQYAAILLDRPAWSWSPPPYGAAVLDVRIFDAYYKDDTPVYYVDDDELQPFANFCFTMRLALDVDEANRMDFEAGAGLGAPIEDGPYAGWYPWGIEAVVGKQEGQWRLLDLGSGGANVWLPYGIGWDFPDDRLTAEQLIRLYFVTWGNTREWRLLRTLAGKPQEEILEVMEHLEGPRHEELLRGMEKYNAAYGDVLDWAPSFELDAYLYEHIYKITGVVVGYGADTLCVTVTDPGDSPLAPGTEMYVGLLAWTNFSWLDGAGYKSTEYPLLSTVVIEYTGEVFADDSGVCRPEKQISIRLAE